VKVYTQNAPEKLHGPVTFLLSQKYDCLLWAGLNNLHNVFPFSIFYFSA